MDQKEEKKRCEKAWAKHKYYVLSKSAAIYRDIRNYLKEPVVSLEVLNGYFKQAETLSENKGQVINAFQHVWGYFKRHATEEEKRHFFEVVEGYQKDIITQEEVIRYIQQLLVRYPNQYLEQSVFLKVN